MTFNSSSFKASIALLCCTFSFCLNEARAWQSDNGDGTYNNPVLYADYPDPDIVRVGSDFYMVSTTFVDSPGINVLHSKDLVSWEISSHVCTNLDGGNSYNMVGGTAYRAGFWASSIRYYNGTFYVVANPQFANSRIYYTTNAAGPWQYYQLNQVTYDPGLFIETNGTAYIVAGHGPESVFVLNSDFSQIIGVSNNVVNATGEGSHVVRRGNYYYVFTAYPGTWPYQLYCSRATNIFGPYETNHSVLTETTGGHQGGIVDMPDGTDYGFVMKDSGAVGRMTYICPITWSSGWPVWGSGGVPTKATKPIAGQPIMQPATSDNFTNSTLGLQWQWNHNPDNTRWSLTDRPGYLRLRPTQATSLWTARNTLTQKGQGPQSQGIVKFDVSNMKNGDIAGFGTLGTVNGQIYITADSAGNRTLGMTVDDRQHSTTNYAAGYPFYGTNLYLRADLNFQSNLGTCSFSADGTTWTRLGPDFPLAYDISVGTFQGEKFAIFCYNTSTASSPGYVDVDSFTFNPSFTTVSAQRARPHLNVAHTTFVGDNGQELRGPFTSTEWTGPVSAQNIASMKNLGFNAIHLYGESFDINYPTNGSTAPGYSQANIDAIVAETRTNGLYLVITIGNGANNGNYNAAYITNFWNLYGARYANETHVLYEIQNEPVAWGPPYSAGNATPPGGLDMEIAAYRAIRANAPNTPVLLFTYAVFGGTGGASSAMTDIHAFNTTVFGNANAVWTNEAVAFHGYNGWSGTSTAVSTLISDGYPSMMTEYGTGDWGSTDNGVDAEMTWELERQNVSWLSFLHVPGSGVSSDVSLPQCYSNVVKYSGLGWTPDYGSFPSLRGPYNNNGYARSIPASYNNNFLSGTPLRLQAEDFDTGGEGVAYHELTTNNLSGQYRPNEAVDIEVCTDTGGGYDVTSTAAGEWLQYTVMAQYAGYYNLSLRYAAPSNGCVVQITCKGQDQTGSWLLPSAGSSSTWATVTKPVLLEYGHQILHINILNGGFNLNWMELTPVSSGFIPNGTYKFLNASSGLVPTGQAGTNLVIASSYAGSTYQQWNLQHVGGGQYKITAVTNGYSWNVNNNALTVGSGWGTGDNRSFVLSPTSGSFYSLLPVGNGVPVESSGSNPNSIDANNPYSGGANQQWAIADPAAPMFPIGLTVTPLSTTQVTLTWTAVAGATSYNLKRGISSGGPYTTIATGITGTSYTDTVPVGMKFYYVVSAVSGGSESPNSAEAFAGLPYPWKTQDIGSVNLTGSASLGSGVFTVTGAGADIWGTADAFRSAYVTVTGDCTMIARVTSVQNADGWSKAGIMIRASLDAGAANTFIAVTPTTVNGVTWQYRTSTGGNSVNSAYVGVTAPYWVKLVRSGSTFTGYRSPDGVTWTQVGSTQTISTMPSTAYIGLAVTSHNSSTLCTATFDNVTAPGWTNVSPPQTPANLNAAIANWNVALSWTASGSAISYNVKRAVTYGGPFTLLTNLTTTSCTDATVGSGTNYYYVVSALNAGGESANSAQAIVAAQNFAPSGLSVTPTSATQASLVWNVFTNATSYNVKRSTTSGGPYSTVATGVLTTNYTDTFSAGMKYYYIVSAIVGGHESPNSSEATINLPYPWLTQDIGNVVLSGSAAYVGGLFTLVGAGDDIQNAADAFRFVYLPASGDGTIVARVASAPSSSVSTWAKAGVMMRESLNTGSANLLMAVTPGNGTTWQNRTSTGGSTGYGNQTNLTAPYWVKLNRAGSVFTAYDSPDGVNWTLRQTTTYAMASSYYVGLALTSHNTASLGTATFDNVTATGWPNAAPPVSPASLTATAGNALAALSWPAASGAASYNVKRALVNGGPYTILTNVTTTSYTDSGLLIGTNYYYVVSALNRAGESANSTQASVTGQVFTPSGLSATAVSSSQISLVWNVVSNTATYNVKRSTTNGGPYATVATGLTATNYPDSGLAGGTIYYYVVSAVVAGRETPNSSQTMGVTLSGTLGSLLHRYSFLETSGTSVADSVGGPIWAGTLPNGGTLSGNQLTLAPGSQQYASLPPGIVSPLSNFTIMAWVNISSNANANRIFDFGGNTTTNMLLTPQNGNSGTVRFAITTNGGGAEQQINCSSTLTTGVWHQVAVTLNGATGILYLDGVAAGTNSGLTLNPSSLGSTGNNYLGKSQYSDPYLSGSLDDFRIYNVGLSAAEIAATAALGPSQLLSSTNNPPGIVLQPESQLAALGCTANFTVQATGAASLYYQWWKDNTALNGQTNASLTVTNIGALDFGNYYAVVTSTTGWTVSSNALLALNYPPITTPCTVQRYSWGGVRIWASDLLASDSDPDGEALSVVAVSPTSVGGGLVTLTNNWVYYAPPPGVTNSDSFTYTVSDGHCGGTALGSVSVEIESDLTPTGKLFIDLLPDGTAHLTFVGLPGSTCRLQYTEDLANPNWQDLTSQTADSYGSFEYVDLPSSGAPARYYRSVWP